MKKIIENLGRDREDVDRAVLKVYAAIESTKIQVLKLENKIPALLERKEALTRAIKLLQDGIKIE